MRWRQVDWVWVDLMTRLPSDRLRINVFRSNVCDVVIFDTSTPLNSSRVITSVTQSACLLLGPDMFSQIKFFEYFCKTDQRFPTWGTWDISMGTQIYIFLLRVHKRLGSIGLGGYKSNQILFYFNVLHVLLSIQNSLEPTRICVWSLCFGCYLIKYF